MQNFSKRRQHVHPAAVRQGSVRDSSIEKKLIVCEFYKQSAKKDAVTRTLHLQKALREHRLHISISKLSHRPNQLKVQRCPIPRAHTKSRVSSPRRNKETTVKMKLGSCARIGRVSSTTMGPQERCLTLYSNSEKPAKQRSDDT